MADKVAEQDNLKTNILLMRQIHQRKQGKVHQLPEKEQMITGRNTSIDNIMRRIIKNRLGHHCIKNVTNAKYHTNVNRF